MPAAGLGPDPGGSGRGRAAGGAAGEGPGPTDPTALALAHATPDAELLPVGEGVLEALVPHDAAPAHLLGLLGGGSPLGEEEVRVHAEAVGEVLPPPLPRLTCAVCHEPAPLWALGHQWCNYNTVMSGYARGESRSSRTAPPSRRRPALLDEV